MEYMLHPSLFLCKDVKILLKKPDKRYYQNIKFCPYYKI